MKDYTLYIEFYGRKIKTTVSAENELKARMVVARRLNILKIEEIKKDEGVEFLKNIFGMK